MGMVPDCRWRCCARAEGRAFGGVRRVLGGRAAGPDQRRRGQGPDHQDEGWRAGREVPLKRNADAAVAETSIEQVVVLRRTGNDGHPLGRPARPRWHDLVEGQSADCPPEALDAEGLLYLLYTSRTRPKPKGSCTPRRLPDQVATTHQYVFDLHPDTDACTGVRPTSAGSPATPCRLRAAGRHTTSILYEARPTSDKDRWWEIIEKYKVTILYAPTAIGPSLKWGTRAGAGSTTCRACGCLAAWVSRSTRGLDLVPHQHRRRPLPSGRHLVADRDGDDHGHPCPGPSPPSRGRRPASRSPGSTPTSWTAAGNSVGIPGGGAC